MADLDAKVAALAARDRDLAVELLKELVRIPADHVEAAADSDELADALCGLSNHEGPRLEYLRRRIIELDAVRSPDDVGFDRYGNLVWTVEDPDDGIPRSEKKVIWLDGHSDTVQALRAQWKARTGGAIDAYLGLVDASRLDRAFLRQELGWLPPDEEWAHLVFGRGSADQLGGVVAQVFATRLLLELADEGALAGVIVRSYATAAEEDNDGGGPRYLMNEELPGAPPEAVPDVVVLTEGTGDARKGALGIYRGQRGRMQIEVEVTGRSCHGSMPWEGKNPLEYGAAILVEAALKAREGEGLADHELLGSGTRTASWAHLDTPSDCAVPERFTFRFDRRLTVGETASAALADIERLESVAAARAEGLRVDIRVPRYETPTWKGYTPHNPQVYPGWITPEDHPAIRAAVRAYRSVISPHVPHGNSGGALRKEPRIDRWIFSTDGVGYPIPADDRRIAVPERKRWVVSGAVKHPAMFGLGPGIEQNTHKIGECLDTRELVHAIAFLARFPSVFAEGASTSD